MTRSVSLHLKFYNRDRPRHNDYIVLGLVVSIKLSLFLISFIQNYSILPTGNTHGNTGINNKHSKINIAKIEVVCLIS